jgi:hypothetical protein
MKLLLLLKNIIELVLVGIWILLFIFSGAMAMDLMPLLIVLLFVNIDSKVGAIIKQLKEMKESQS